MSANSTKLPNIKSQNQLSKNANNEFYSTLQDSISPQNMKNGRSNSQLAFFSNNNKFRPNHKQ